MSSTKWLVRRYFKEANYEEFRLVNNAGICYEAGRPRTKIHETSEEAWDTTMAVNLRSIFLGCKYAITQMLKQDLLPSGDRGWIINLSSIYGLVAGRYIRELSSVG